MNGVIIKVLNWYIPWRSPAAPRILIQVGFSTIFTAWITYAGLQFLYSYVYEVHFSNMVFRRGLFLFMVISWLYNAIYTGRHFFDQWRKSIVEAEELKRQNLLSQYETLKNQVNPHFLFNGINTLIGLIDEDPNQAKEYGYFFAKVYRYILDKGNLQLIQLKDEVALIELYKKIYEGRFGDGLQLSIDIQVSKEVRMIAPLSLQMLVENAVKHNTAALDQPLAIEIKIENDYLQVKNNIQRKNNIQSTGTGLKNIIDRYKILTDRPVFIDEKKHFIVRLPLLNRETI